LREAYRENRDLAVFRGLRYLRNVVRDRTRDALRIPRETRFLRGCCDAVFSSEPVVSSPSAPAEIHTLVCSRHLSMYVMAVKSLLRFGADFSVVVHDDGSLTAADRSKLETHIEGIRVVSKDEADRELAVLLKDHPCSLRFRRENVVAMQLFDLAHYARTKRILSLDSDTLFLQRPQELIDWAAGSRPEILHLHETCPYSQKEFLTKLGCPYPPNFCMGLAAFPKSLVDLDLIERTLARAGTFDWFSSQNVFPVLIHARSPRADEHFLDTRKYQDVNTLQAGAVFRHYWSSGFMTDDRLKRTFAEDTRKFFSETGVIV
jgi:hypothetical protein